MIQTERNTDHEEVLNSTLDGRLAITWTSLPAEVVSYDPTKLTCSCQPTVKVSLRAADGSFTWVALPLLVDVPVGFPMGGGFFVTFPLEEGDEVLVVFADRCIDGWWSKGGVQIPPELRFHDLSDGFAICGFKSLHNVPGGLSATNFQVIGPAGVILDVSPAGLVTINAPMGLVINGNVEVNGAVMASGEGTFGADAIPVSTHLHGGVSPGGGNTGVPLP